MKKHLGILILVVMIAGSALAAGSERSFGFTGVGPRIGFTVNPDQIHIGGQLDFGDLTPGLMVLPNLEVGFGDHTTTVAPSFELDYRFRHNWLAWTPYLGGGLGPVFYSFDGGAGSVTKFGVYIEGGVSRQLTEKNLGRFFAEVKLGFADAPDVKFTAGWMFGK
jgi:hypothetical protein